MRLIVWGTGNVYKRYKKYLCGFEIVKLCDSNPDKKGRSLDGIEIIAPEQIMEYESDYVLVMAYAENEICRQAKALGIAAKKIITYSQFWQLKREDFGLIHSGNKRMCFQEWLLCNSNCILVISHNFSYTGVPVALKNMTMVLREMGYSVLMAAMTNGSFVKELQLEKIDYIEDLELGYQSEYFKKILREFRGVVIGTFYLYKIGEVIKNANVPTIWWVHETHEKYYIGKGELPKSQHIKFFAVANRVISVFREHYSGCEIQKLHYCIPDTYKKKSRKVDDAKMVAAVIGSIDSRKAQDIFLEAVIHMPPDYRKRLQIILVGQMTENEDTYIEKIKEQKGKLAGLLWIPELTQEEITELYSKIDILVCPSRDDPMPIVVTEAMMHGKVCVVSENVGQAEFIKQSENGFVFSNENVMALRKILMWLLDNDCQGVEIGRASREIYEAEFSVKTMGKNLKKILEEMGIVKDM